ncbi:MAG: hypothetical protein AUG49_13645 [Catenulispora sp. 13_1_20CM_3_70_7]|nr:MAG: hypothetical protein AUG49_13645 [Catenulispora sp. 13_1_20CM_3_70_7]
MAELDLQGLRAYAEEMLAAANKVQSRAQEFRAEVQAVRAAAKSPDGHVTVTVGHNGKLVKLQLDPRIYRKPDSARLAQTIIETIERATVEAHKQVTEVSARYAPGVDISSHLAGKGQSGQLGEFIYDQMAKADQALQDYRKAGD